MYRKLKFCKCLLGKENILKVFSTVAAVLITNVSVLNAFFRAVSGVVIEFVHFLK